MKVNYPSEVAIRQEGFSYSPSLSVAVSYFQSFRTRVVPVGF